MDSAHHHLTIWLHESQLAAYVDAFTHHLIEGAIHAVPSSTVTMYRALPAMSGRV